MQTNLLVFSVGLKSFFNVGHAASVAGPKVPLGVDIPVSICNALIKPLIVGQPVLPFSSTGRSRRFYRYP